LAGCAQRLENDAHLFLKLNAFDLKMCEKKENFLPGSAGTQACKSFGAKHERAGAYICGTSCLMRRVSVCASLTARQAEMLGAPRRAFLFIFGL
jgi:hypothetical protein